MSADAGRPRCSLSQKYSAAPTTNRPQMRRETPRNMTRRPSATRTALSLKVLPLLRSGQKTINRLVSPKISTLFCSQAPNAGPIPLRISSSNREVCLYNTGSEGDDQTGKDYPILLSRLWRQPPFRSSYFSITALLRPAGFSRLHPGCP